LLFSVLKIPLEAGKEQGRWEPGLTPAQARQCLSHARAAELDERLGW